MTHADRGNKRRCPNCGAAYYDLGRSPVICPKCHAPYVEAARVPMRPAPRTRAEPPAPLDEPAEEMTVFDEDEALGGGELDNDIVPEEDQDEDVEEDRD